MTPTFALVVRKGRRAGREHDDIGGGGPQVARVGPGDEVPHDDRTQARATPQLTTEYPLP